MRNVIKKIIFVVILVLLFAAMVFAQGGGVRKRRPLPDEYGRVVINNYSEKAGLSPVQFDHWWHRSRYTCRLCHVDIAFVMKAGSTGIKAEDNQKGYYCGTCHNGKTPFEDRTVFAACSDKYTDEDVPRCNRCHSLGKRVKRLHDFADFAKDMPKGRFGNGIDWDKAEEKGLIKLQDYIEGVSIRRPAMAIQKDFSLTPKVTGLPEIIFSHKKHTVWDGCEGCHPEIFIGVKRGLTKYTMADIFDGRYCGVCHTSVAFPLLDCQRCHTKTV
jgi:c(7)-type cytochrome triheme protein